MSIFSKVSLASPKKNKFDLSHERKMSMQMGQLIPMLCQEVLPGDSFRVNTEIMIRFAPLLAPIMHRVNVFTHYFFVPNRLLWDEWQDFITGGRTGASAPLWPHITLNTANTNLFLEGGLADYLGIPPLGDVDVTNEVKISALPFRAYQLVYDEYYRDQNLTAPLDILKTGGEVLGAELIKLTTMRMRAWEKDYFTSALPWAQRGPEVLMPIEGTGSVTYRDQAVGYKGNDPTQPAAAGPASFDNSGTGFVTDQDDDLIAIRNIDQVNFQNTSVTINTFRRAERLQMWFEKTARAGARYIEVILGHFGVRSSDARLQRPEYLNGARTPVVISEVLSTFQQADGEGNPQANMAGHGISVGKTNGFRRSFEEHGFVIGIMSIIPRTTYQQGINREWFRNDKFEYAWPLLANLGEQEVRNQELFYDPEGVSGQATGTFGYQSRYSEYKFKPSTVHGKFRSNLAYWHMGRIFDSPPVLNTDFVTSDPTTRIFAVEEADEHIYCQLYHRMDAIRPLPYYGTPTL